MGTINSGITSIIMTTDAITFVMLGKQLMSVNHSAYNRHVLNACHSTIQLQAIAVFYQVRQDTRFPMTINAGITSIIMTTDAFRYTKNNKLVRMYMEIFMSYCSNE